MLRDHSKDKSNRTIGSWEGTETQTPFELCLLLYVPIELSFLNKPVMNNSLGNSRSCGFPTGRGRGTTCGGGFLREEEDSGQEKAAWHSSARFAMPAAQSV